MKYTALIIGILAGVAMIMLAGLGTNTPTASADNGPHVATGSDATPDKCASCHRIHTGQNEYLLKEAGSVEDFCFSCHGNGGPGSDLAAQDGSFYGETTPGMPYGGKTASTTVGLRGGGFDEARNNSTDPSRSNNPNPTPAPAVTIGILPVAAAVNTRHDMEVTGTMWGNGPVGSVGPGPSATLECTSCHDPHGNGNYRILRSVPTGSGGAGYAIPDTYPKALTDYTTTNYLNMYFGGVAPAVTPEAGTATPGVGISILKDTAAWCSQCHTRYLAVRRGTVDPTPGPGTPAAMDSRWDSGDSIYTSRHTSAGWGRSSSTGNASWNNRACITCHASHGSTASMTGTYSQSIEYPGGATPVATPGPGNNERGAMLKMDNRGICRKCHVNQ